MVLDVFQCFFFLVLVFLGMFGHFLSDFWVLDVFQCFVLLGFGSFRDV